MLWERTDFEFTAGQSLSSDENSAAEILLRHSTPSDSGVFFKGCLSYDSARQWIGALAYIRQASRIWIKTFPVQITRRSDNTLCIFFFFLRLGRLEENVSIFLMQTAKQSDNVLFKSYAGQTSIHNNSNIRNNKKFQIFGIARRLHKTRKNHCESLKGTVS